MKGFIALPVTLATLAVAGTATASGPINAPTPVFPDGASVGTYLDAFATTQFKAVGRTDRETERWWDAPIKGPQIGRARRNHRQAKGKVLANSRALARDLTVLNGCQTELVRSNATINRALNQRQNALGTFSMVRILRSERTISFQQGRLEGITIKMAVCLNANGWQFAPAAPPAT